MGDSLFPRLSCEYILSFQFSAWYPKFAKDSIKSTIIRPLSKDFCDYLRADGVFVPEGSEDVPFQSGLSDDEDSDEESDSEDHPVFSFPTLDEEIRQAIIEYGAVFPKLNFSSPRDAAWVLPPSSPLKCTSPADVYLLLKSSDFISHDLNSRTVFEGCKPDAQLQDADYPLELVLRKWYPVDRSRELRCFVRDDKLLGVSQRDMNYYEFLNDEETSRKIVNTVSDFWISKVRPGWITSQDYTFDLLLTRDLSRAHIVDFNPYAPKTDPLLFTYEELERLRSSASNEQLPEFHVIDSNAHPAVTRAAPANQHNMVPFDALSMANGLHIEEFSQKWKDGIFDSLQTDE